MIGAHTEKTQRANDRPAGGSDVLQGMAGDDSFVGDGAGVAATQIGNDFLDGSTGGGILFGENDTVLAGADHTLATTIEIGNAGAHQDVFDAAGYPGVTLTGGARATGGRHEPIGHLKPRPMPTIVAKIIRGQMDAATILGCQS